MMVGVSEGTEREVVIKFNVRESQLTMYYGSRRRCWKATLAVPNTSEAVANIRWHILPECFIVGDSWRTWGDGLTRVEEWANWMDSARVKRNIMRVAQTSYAGNGYQVASDSTLAPGVQNGGNVSDFPSC